MEKKLKRKEFVIEDEMGNLIGDVDLISLVTDPAIELSAQFFSQNKIKEMFAKTDEEKMILTAPVMIPNKDILRMDQETGEYFYCYFSEETILKASQVFAKNGGFLKTSLEHEPVKTKDAYVFESWIVGDNDKIYKMGYSKEDVPVGSWAVSFKVESPEFWALLKDVKKSNPNFGFSIESVFAIKEVFATVNEIVEISEKTKNNTEEETEKEPEQKVTNSKKAVIKSLIEEIALSEEIQEGEKISLIKRIIEKL